MLTITTGTRGTRDGSRRGTTLGCLTAVTVTVLTLTGCAGGTEEPAPGPAASTTDETAPEAAVLDLATVQQVLDDLAPAGAERGEDPYELDFDPVFTACYETVGRPEDHDNADAFYGEYFVDAAWVRVAVADDTAEAAEFAATSLPIAAGCEGERNPAIDAYASDSGETEVDGEPAAHTSFTANLPTGEATDAEVIFLLDNLLVQVRTGTEDAQQAADMAARMAEEIAAALRAAG